MNHIKAVFLITLFLAGIFLVPSSGMTSTARLQDKTTTSTEILNTNTNELADLPNDRVFKVALYHETNTSIPTNLHGGLNSNYSVIYPLLVNAGFEVDNVTFENILNYELTTTNYDVIVLADNCPRENISNLVKEFWLAGGGVLSLDSAISYLGYYGILFRENESISDGRNDFWSYNFNANGTVANRHPVTQSYATGTELRFMFSDWAQVDLTAFATSSVWPYTTVLAVDPGDADWAVAVAVDAADRGGRVVQIGIPVQAWPSDWNDMIIDAIGWLAPRPKARIAYDFSHNARLSVDSWDVFSTVWSATNSFGEFRDALVSRKYTFDKFYPSAAGNFTASRLADYDLMVIDWPDLNFTMDEVNAVRAWVSAGGGLLVLGDRAGLGGDGYLAINFLLGGYGIQLGLDNTLTNVLASVSSPIHPTAEGCTTLQISFRNNITVSGDGSSIWEYDGNVIAAATPYGDGRAVLLSDMNIFDNGQISSASNRQFAINVANWLSASSAKVLVYTDDPYGFNYYRNSVTNALNQLEIPFYLIFTSLGINASLNGTWFGDEWDLVIIDNCNFIRSETYPNILEYLKSGRPMILTSWTIYAHNTNPLLRYIGVNSTGLLTGDHPSYIWDDTHPIFDGFINYGVPTLNVSGTSFGTDGATFTVYDNATALTGATATEQPGNASIVLSNNGQMLLNGFMLNNLYGDADDSAYLDGFELYMNEIVYMNSLPGIDHPADISFEDGTTGHDITWTPTDSSPDTYEILVDGTVEDSGSWDGSAISYTVDEVGLGVHSVECRVVGDSGQPFGDIVVVTVVDTTDPALNSPADLTITVGSTGNSITWIAQEPNPSYYVVTMNSTAWASGTWDGSSIVVDLDALDIGVYFFKVRVNDTLGHYAEDTVVVTVVQGFPIDTTTLIIIAAAIAAVVIIGIVCAKRRGAAAASKPKPKKKK